MVMRTLSVAVFSALLAACAVGPNYVRPGDPDVSHFVRNEAGEAPVQNEAEFWHGFGDAQLDQLVDAALAHNHDLRIAYANWQQANSLLRNAKYDYLPTLEASAQAARVRESADQLPGYARDQRDFDQYQGSAGLSWELDFFGRIRRGVESQRAEAQAGASDLAAMQVAVVGELVRTYFQLRGWQEQLRIAQDNVDSQQRTQSTLQLREQAGMAAPFDVDRGRTQLESTLSRIPALQAQIATATHRIAVLTGQPPEALIADLETPAMFPALPADIAVDAPGDLLRRRPDVAAAEQRLHAATARIGVATADLFPHFTLGALFGTDANVASALFERDSETRLLSLGMDGSFLNVGRVRARIAAAKAENAADLAQYQKTVLGALEETENALVGVSRSNDELEHLQQAAAAGERAMDVAQSRFDHGAIDVLELLDAERSNLQAEDAFMQGRVRNALAVVALHQALAGGWPRRVPEQGVAKN